MLKKQPSANSTVFLCLKEANHHNMPRWPVGADAWKPEQIIGY
jgi:hypothetical protein